MSKVSLVGMTTPSVMTGCHTAEDLVAYAARVSNPGNQNNVATAPKLLKYLAKHHHWSPFEMVSVTLEIKTTRDISRQIIRHRSFSFQEFSQRYAISSDFCVRDCRLQDPQNRQASDAIDKTDPAQRELAEMWRMKQIEINKLVSSTYEWALSNGIAKEQARAILPEGNTETTLYMAGTLRSWIHYCALRCGIETQLEHRVVAEQCWNIIQHHFPSLEEVLQVN